MKSKNYHFTRIMSENLPTNQMNQVDQPETHPLLISFSLVSLECDDYDTLLKEIYPINSDVAHNIAINFFGTFYDYYMIDQPVDWVAIRACLDRSCSSYLVYVGDDCWEKKQESVTQVI